MFTGIIEEIGTISSIQALGAGKKISIIANKVFSDLKIDDSISINGVCQTVVNIQDKQFVVEAVEETLKKTTFNKLISGNKVNLERALTLNTRLGGHLALGHVDCVGSIYSIQKQTAGILIWINFPQEFNQLIVPIGSICIDGVSLTIAQTENSKLMVSIIPHTYEMTTFNKYKSGTEVNLEFDIIGKYIKKLTSSYFNKTISPKESSVFEQFLSQPID